MKTKSKKIFLISYLNLALFLVLLLTSCFSDTTDISDADDNEPLKIAVFLYRNDDHFINSVKDAIIKTSEENTESWGEDTYEFSFFDGKNQNEIQVNQIKQAIADGYDALAVNIVERSSATEIIEMAKKADVPVVFFNRQPIDVDMARWDKLYYVGLDGTQSGIMQGEIILDYLKMHPDLDKNEDGVIQYIILQGQYNHQDTIFRTKYSVETLSQAGIQLEELAKETANWQKNQAESIMNNLLKVYGNKIELVISNNDIMALGARDAILKKYHKINMAIIGVDGIKPALEALEKGEIIGTVLNDANKQGKAVAEISYYLSRDIDPSTKLNEIESGTYYWIDYEKIIKENKEKIEMTTAEPLPSATVNF